MKLKLKTHEYDSLLNSKQDHRQVKLVFKSNETERASIGIQTIKEEPKEIGVVNIPASLSSQPKDPPSKSGTKRTASNVGDRTIIKTKRMKTEIFNSTSRMTRQLTAKKKKFTCSDCFAKWGSEIKLKYDGDPDKTGAPKPSDAIQTFASLKDYKIHVQQDYCCQVAYCPAFILACRPPEYRATDSICKVCDCRFDIREAYEQHKDIEHCNINDMTNKQMFELYLKYKTEYGY